MNELPKIFWKGKTYIFDYKLSELRTDEKPIKFVCLNNQEAELLSYAVQRMDRSLISANMRDLGYKL